MPPLGGTLMQFGTLMLGVLLGLIPTTVFLGLAVWIQRRAYLDQLAINKERSPLSDSPYRRIGGGMT